MKPILIVILIVLMGCSLNAQVRRENSNKKILSETYKNRSDSLMKIRNRINHIGNWILVGGLAVSVTGYSLIASTTFNNNPNRQRGEVMFNIGNVIALGSIPFFIKAHKYKMKARLEMENETLNMHFKNSSYTALAFKYSF